MPYLRRMDELFKLRCGGTEIGEIHVGFKVGDCWKVCAAIATRWVRG